MLKILHKNNNAFFRQLLFLASLILIGVIIFGQLKFFVGAVLGAFTLYVVFRGILFWLTEKRHWPHWVAGLTLTFACLILLGGIGYVLFKVIAAEMPAIDTSQIITGINGLVDKVNNMLGIDVVPDDAIEKSGGVLTKIMGGVLNTTYSLAANVFMMLVIVYFMFTAGRKMECYIYRYAPFKGRSLCLLRTEVKNMVYSNAVGIPLIMVAQTLVACLIYWLIGMDNYLFWGFLTAICGLIPLIGTGLVYAPIAIYYAATGEIWTGILVALYGILIISNTDNVIRIVMMRKVNDTHPLIVIFGVILGIPLFGFWGIIFGPLFISAFLLLIKIYYVEYNLLTTPEEAEKIAWTPAESENPVPMKSINNLKAIKAFRILKTARPDNMEKKNIEKDQINKDYNKNLDKSTPEKIVDDIKHENPKDPEKGEKHIPE